MLALHGVILFQTTVGKYVSHGSISVFDLIQSEQIGVQGEEHL